MKKRMQLTSAHPWDAVIIAAFLAAGVFVRLAWQYTDKMVLQPGQGNFERFTALSTAVAAIGSLFAFVVLVAYTRETFMLRQTAQRQLEVTEKPILLFKLSSADNVQLDRPMKLLEPVIMNIGAGPALNVAISTIKGEGVEVKFKLPNEPLIEGRGRLPLKPFILQEGEANGMSESLLLLADLFRRNEIPSDIIVQLQFESIAGRKYRVRNRVSYNAAAKLISTSPDLPIEED